MFPENIQIPPWKELKILKGSGARRPSSGVRGLKTKIHFQRGMYNDCFSGTLAGFSGAFVGPAAFFLPTYLLAVNDFIYTL